MIKVVSIKSKAKKSVYILNEICLKEYPLISKLKIKNKDFLYLKICKRYF